MSAQGGSDIRSMTRTEAPHIATEKHDSHIRKPAALAMLTLMMLCGCDETGSFGPMVHEQPPLRPKSGPVTAGESTAAPEVANAPARVLTEQPETVMGNGEFVAQPTTGGGAATQTPAGDITLNFVNADVREVLPRVLGDVLHLNYTIDPKIQATVTVQTSRPLRQQDVLPVLQEVLRASGLTLVASDGIYRLLA